MPFIQVEDMKTAEPLPGWAGRFWGAVAVVPGDTPHPVRALSGGRAIVANHPVRHELR